MNAAGSLGRQAHIEAFLIKVLLEYSVFGIVEIGFHVPPAHAGSGSKPPCHLQGLFAKYLICKDARIQTKVQRRSGIILFADGDDINSWSIHE